MTSDNEEDDIIIYKEKVQQEKEQLQQEQVKKNVDEDISKKIKLIIPTDDDDNNDNNNNNDDNDDQKETGTEEQHVNEKEKRKIMSSSAYTNTTTDTDTDTDNINNNNGSDGDDNDEVKNNFCNTGEQEQEQEQGQGQEELKSVDSDLNLSIPEDSDTTNNITTGIIDNNNNNNNSDRGGNVLSSENVMNIPSSSSSFQKEISNYSSKSQQKNMNMNMNNINTNYSPIPSRHLKMKSNVTITKIVLGICAMEKKAHSKPMKEIMKRLDNDIYEIVIFGDDMILRQKVEKWPIVDCLIAFYSTGFPLDKCIQYVDIRKPFLLNDLEMQYTLLDRRKVYELLEKTGIDTPYHAIVDRDQCFIKSGKMLKKKKKSKKDKEKKNKDKDKDKDKDKANKKEKEKEKEKEKIKVKDSIPGSSKSMSTNDLSGYSSSSVMMMKPLNLNEDSITEDFSIDEEQQMISPSSSTTTTGASQLKIMTTEMQRIEQTETEKETKTETETEKDTIQEQEKDTIQEQEQEQKQKQKELKQIEPVSSPSKKKDDEEEEVVEEEMSEYDEEEEVVFNSSFDDNVIEEWDEYIVCNGTKINKPLVEKPVDAEDHNIYIYYPMSAGGGSKRLFRKIGDRSSEFYPEQNDVRRDGSYIYEEFVETQGTDVKVYTVGSDYGHAEARKSPVVDGKVNRDSNGKEIRFPVILSPAEKEIARKVVLSFKQTVCGFDILRIQGRSYVCDVNGWSFVKSSKKYYDDTAQLLGEFMLAAMDPSRVSGVSAIGPLLASRGVGLRGNYKNRINIKKLRHTKSASPRFADRIGLIHENNGDSDGNNSVNSNNSSDSKNKKGYIYGSQTSGHIRGNNGDDTPLSPNLGSYGSFHEDSSNQEELRCVIGIIRHGDRTPKQKLKMDVAFPVFLDFHKKYAKHAHEELKIKNKTQLQDFLALTKSVIADLTEKTRTGQIELNLDVMYKLVQVRDVFERFKISGFNRKLQLKPKKWITVDENDNVCSQDDINCRDIDKNKNKDKDKDKNTADNKDNIPKLVEKVSELQLILKWGGDLTKLGIDQSQFLGQQFPQIMYPDPSGGGVLRLHSTFRHDLKVMASDEGRVMKTAASFTKGMLELEGDLTPILVSLVHREKNTVKMLDPSGNRSMKRELEECKNHLSDMMQQDKALTEQHLSDMVPTGEPSVLNALRQLGNPKEHLHIMLDLIDKIVGQIEGMVNNHFPLAKVDLKRLSLSPILKALNLFYGSEEDSMVQKKDSEKLTTVPYGSESLLLMLDRWRKLRKDIYDKKKGIFDLTKVPDVHDNIRYDCLHNRHLGLRHLDELFMASDPMACCVVPQEYGIDEKEKRILGSHMCHSLLEKIKYDLIISRSNNNHDMRYKLDTTHAADLPINSLGRQVRTRLYFTSESHLHSLLNVLRYPEEGQIDAFSKDGKIAIENIAELCYLTHLVIRLFEDMSYEEDDPRRFRTEIFLSPGTNASPTAELDDLNDAGDLDKNIDKFEKWEMRKEEHLCTAPLTCINPNLTCMQLEECLDNAMSAGHISLSELDQSDISSSPSLAYDQRTTGSLTPQPTLLDYSITEVDNITPKEQEPIKNFKVDKAKQAEALNILGKDIAINIKSVDSPVSINGKDSKSTDNILFKVQSAQNLQDPSSPNSGAMIDLNTVNKDHFSSPVRSTDDDQHEHVTVDDIELEKLTEDDDQKYNNSERESLTNSLVVGAAAGAIVLIGLSMMSKKS